DLRLPDIHFGDHLLEPVDKVYYTLQKIGSKRSQYDNQLPDPLGKLAQKFHNDRAIFFHIVDEVLEALRLLEASRPLPEFFCERYQPLFHVRDQRSEGHE